MQPGIELLPPVPDADIDTPAAKAYIERKFAEKNATDALKFTVRGSCISNREVFSLYLNVAIAMSAARSSGGKQFQTRGP